MSDVLPFMRAWAANPLQVASLVPSSRALARAITAEITPASAPVIELGPGTGVFTRALLARGITQDQLTLIEYGADFAILLQRRYPAARVIRGDAARLREIGGAEGGRAGAVISGLPLLSMPPRQVFAILKSAFAHMRDEGVFYQFTYGPRCPIVRPILQRLDLQATSIGWVFNNFPPAQVYRVTRRSDKIAAV